MAFKESAKNVVEQLACIDRLKIKCRFTTRFEAQHTLSKKAIRAVSVNTETARTVNKLRPKLLMHQSQQIGIRDLTIVRSPSRARPFALDLNSSQRSVTEKTVVPRER